PQVAGRHPARHPAAVPGGVGAPLHPGRGARGGRRMGPGRRRLPSHPAAGPGHPLVGGRGARARRRDRDAVRGVPGHPGGPAGPDRRAAGGVTVLLRNAREGVGIAVGALRANKLRSFLTILGVVIGVTTVMAIASMVQGIRTQIFNAIETAGPTAFYVVRFFSQTPLNPDRLPYEVRIRPVLQTSDAEAIRRIPEIRYAGMWVQLFQRIEYEGARTQTLTVFGADDGFMEIQGGTLLRGRFFSRAELAGAPVVVLEADVVDRLFGRVDPLARYVPVGRRALQVIGIYQK